MKTKIKQAVVMFFYYVGDFLARIRVTETQAGFWLYRESMLKSAKLQEKWNLPEPWELLDEEYGED